MPSPGHRRTCALAAGVLAALVAIFLARTSWKDASAAARHAADGHGHGPSAEARPGAARSPVARAAPGAAATPGVTLPEAVSLRERRNLPLDFSQVIDQVHFAFRPDGGTWRGGDTTYDVARRSDGGLEVTPYHHAGATRSGGAWVEGSTVRFDPTRAKRGWAVLTAGEPAVAGGERGELRLERRELVEELQNGPQGVEQRWRFEDPPPGSGDLELRIALASGRFVAEAGDGLHFSGGALGVRYGHARWIDGAGVETDIPSRWDGAAIVLRVPADVLERSAFPAVLDPIIAPEFSTGVPVDGPVTGIQQAPALAWGDTCYLVVWQDSHVGSGDLAGTRVSALGEVLDLHGIAISSVVGSSELAPAVAWNGTDFLVVWQDLRNGASADIYGARVSSAGAVLEPAGIPISTAPGVQAAPAVAPAGADWLVVWEDAQNATTTGWDISGTRVSAAGTVLDPIAICTASGDQRAPSVAWDGIDDLVAWQDLRSQGTTGADVYAARVAAATGAVLDLDGIVVTSAAGDQAMPAVAGNGSGALVVWFDPRSAASGDIYGARVSAAGAVQETAGIAISTTADVKTTPAVAWNGAEWLVVWADRRDAASTGVDIHGARVELTGLVLDAITISSAIGNEATPAVACDPSGCFAAWTDARTNASTDIYGARVSAGGLVPDPEGIPLSRAPAARTVPAIGSDGTDLLLAWMDTRNRVTGQDVFVARFRDATDTLLDPAGIPLAVAMGQQTNPTITWDGAAYLVAWQDQRLAPASGAYAIFAARVAPDGAVLDAGAFQVSTPGPTQINPASAYGGSGHLVVWDDSRSGFHDVWAAMVTSVGQSLGDFRIASAGTTPAVAWNGLQYLVVWEANGNVFGARLRDYGGTLVQLDTEIPLSNWTGGAAPAVAGAAGGFVVVWANGDIKGVRVWDSGAVADAVPWVVCAEPVGVTSITTQSEPEIAWNGSDHLIVWLDDRASPGTPGQRDLYGAHLAWSQVGAPTDGFPITGGGSVSSPYVTSDGTDFIVAYQRLDTDPAVNRVQTFFRRIMGPPNVGPTATAGGPYTTPEDVPLDFLISAGDPEGDPLGFRVTVPAAHGTVTGNGLAVRYTPALNYSGLDTFTLVVTDGLVETAPLVVDVTVTAVNDPPVALDQAVGLTEDTTRAVALGAADAEGNPLTYAIVTQPAHGTLTGTPPAVVYAPDPDYAGTDAFTFQANDGTSDSNVATVSLTVDPVNDLPVAHALSVTTDEDVAVVTTLAATDVDGDPLTFTTVTSPAHGRLSGTAPALVYTPDANWSGSDGFTFLARDAVGSSNVAAVTITVNAVPDAPVATLQTVATDEDTAVAITLAATDVELDPLTYTTVTAPRHGRLTGTPPNLTYLPDPNYYGSDSFTFRANDGALDSAPATVTLAIAAVNDPPVATPSSYTVLAGNSLSIMLGGSDIELSPLAYTKLTDPAHGTLSGGPQVYSYTPAAGFSGTDSFTFQVSDGAAASEAATITIHVTAASGPGTTPSSGKEAGSVSAYGCSSTGAPAGLLPLALVGLGLLPLRRRRAAPLLLALALAAPVAAGAAPPYRDIPLPPPPVLNGPPRNSGTPKKARVAVMPVKAGVGVDGQIAALVTDALVAELTDRGLVAITSKDVETALGFERQRQMLGCGEEGCMAQIAGALGVERVIFGDIAQVQGLTVFSVQIFNTRSGSVDRRFHERMRGGDAEDLLDATERAAAELFPGTTRTGTASRRRSILTTGGRPLALVMRGGVDVQGDGGFGLLMLEYRLGRTVRLGAGPLGAGTRAAGGALRVGWYPLALDQLSAYGALEAHVLFPKETVVAGAVALGLEWAFTERFALSLEAPLVFMASAPAEYRKTYFMPGLSAGWRF